MIKIDQIDFQNKMKNITIIMYHYVRPIKGSSYPFIKGLELDEFKTQLNFLEKNYKIITMESLIEFVKKGISLPKNPCLLTFDDGYKDHYLYVFPELKKRKLQGSFFPAPKTIVEKKILDVNKIHFILAKEKNINFLIDKIKKLIDEYKLEEGSKKLNSFSDYWKKNAIASRWDPKEVVFVKRLLQNALPEKIRVRICNFLFEFYIKKNEVEFASELYLNSEELKEMINSNMYVGNHSYQHLWLNTLSKDLQEHEIDKVGGKEPIQVDVRVVATTTRGMLEMVESGKFREDLYFRLNVIPLALPALRERMDDLPVLVEHFLDKHSRLNKRERPPVSPETMAILRDYRWRGNVRELENVVERALLLCDGKEIKPHNLLMHSQMGKQSINQDLARATTSQPTSESAEEIPESKDSALGIEVGMSMKEAEKKLIFETLRETGGNRTKAAKILGISIRTLRNKLNEYRAEGEDIEVEAEN